MAQIGIQRKERSPLLWALALLALALLGWFIVSSVFGRDEASVARNAGAAEVPATPTPPAEVVAVTDFMRFVGERRAADAMARDHGYTAQGLTRLAAAIEAVAMRDTVAGGALAPQLADLRQRAEAIQRDQRATDHALQTREAFLIAASLIGGVQERRFPALRAEAEALTAAARTVDARTPLLQQKADVQTFFDRAAAALRAMAGTAA